MVRIVLIVLNDVLVSVFGLIHVHVLVLFFIVALLRPHVYRRVLGELSVFAFALLFGFALVFIFFFILALVIVLACVFALFPLLILFFKLINLIN